MRQTAIVLAALLAVPATVASQGTQVVEGAVYRCVKAGVLHYTRQPLQGADCSTINYSFVEEKGLPAWVLMAEGNDGMRTYYRADDVKRSGQRVKFWVLDNYASDKYVATSGLGAFRSSIQRMEVNCDERSYRAVQATYYSGSTGEGEVVGTLMSNRLPSSQFAIPGSIGGVMVDTVCALEP